MVEWVQLIFCRILKMICKGYIATQSWKYHSHANTTLAQLYVALRTEIWLMALLSWAVPTVTVSQCAAQPGFPYDPYGMTQRQNECAYSAIRTVRAFMATIILRLQTKLTRVFTPRHQTFSPRGLPTEETMIRSAQAIKNASDFVVKIWMLYFLKFTTVIAIVFLVEWDMWRMRFDRNLPENGNLTCMF